MADEKDGVLAYRLDQAEKNIEALSRELAAFKKEEQALEKKRLLWGISVLGSVIMTLGAVIWSYRSVIFK